MQKNYDNVMVSSVAMYIFMYYHFLIAGNSSGVSIIFLFKVYFLKVFSWSSNQELEYAC